MHIAQFIQRYPPALGGSEAYAARLCDYLAARGDGVSVWTTTAVELGEFWRASSSKPTPPLEGPGTGVPGRSIRRFPPAHFPLRRYILKALSLFPHRPWQCLTAPCNPVCPSMWRAAARYDGPLDAVHATAFPYSFPILCGLKLARRRGVPFFLTPFLHLGDDRTRRQYTSPHLRWLLNQADRVFVQTQLERDAVCELGVPDERVILQGLGVEPLECTGGDRERVRREWGAKVGECVVGHLANNSVEKGTVDLLRAANGKVRVVLAGPEMPNFRTFWDTFPHKASVTRLGVLTETQKRDFFAGIDAFALPSRSDSFGLVLLEAWANAKPNVVYRAGGPGELVRHGIDGLHAEYVGELAERLGELVKDERLRRSLGDNGLSRMGEFLWKDKLDIVRDQLHAAEARTPRAVARRARGPLCGFGSRHVRV
jgi:glycosyltransferase involved in cell wall biosynthesis